MQRTQNNFKTFAKLKPTDSINKLIKEAHKNPKREPFRELAEYMMSHSLKVGCPHKAHAVISSVAEFSGLGEAARREIYQTLGPIGSLRS